MLPTTPPSLSIFRLPLCPRRDPKWVLVVSSVPNRLGTELTTKTHFGSLRGQSGNLKIDKDGGVVGNITIDMKSILVEDLKGRSKEVLENHLKSDDFFGTDKFPTATLEFRSLNRHNNDDGQIFNGNLTIKGITNEVEFSAKLIKQTPLLHAVGKLVFDRSTYQKLIYLLHAAEEFV